MPPETVAPVAPAAVASSAPAVPAAPVAPTAPAVPSQPNAPHPKADPYAAAREKVIEHSVPVEPDQQGSGPAWQYQPRAADGKWTADNPPPDDSAVDETDDTGATDEVASGASGAGETADTPAAESAEPAADGEGETIEVAIPGIRDGDEPVTV